MQDKTPWQRVNKRKLVERLAIEIGPALMFVVALQTVSLKAATIFFVAATAVAVAYSWFEKKHFPVIPFGTLLLAALFGALTVAFNDPDYIQFRATIMNAGGAVALLIGLIIGRLLLKDSLQDGFRLTEGAWWTLSIRMILYLTTLAIANEVIWRTMSLEAWAWFKAVSPLFNIVFLWVNWPLIRASLHAESDGSHGDPSTGDETPPPPLERTIRLPGAVDRLVRGRVT